MNRKLRSILKHLSLALIYGTLVALSVGIGIYVYILESRPDLRVWHLAELDAEFTADKVDSVPDLASYLELEDRLMQQLGEKVYDRIRPVEQRRIVRYHRGSLMDPETRPTNWNRSFELVPEQPVAGALLLHGLSDSPYSLRGVAEMLYGHDVRVLGLRLPGHGTAPSGLVDVHWKDWVAAARIGIRHLGAQIGEAPLYIVGYSNGAALAVEYALGQLEGVMQPRVDALVLLSPAIGVTPVAALARWQARLGKAGDFKKLAWTSIELEFDPFKYNSFPVNAGDQIHQLTNEIGRRIDNLSQGHGLVHFPKTLAFQSVVDATVRPPHCSTGSSCTLNPTATSWCCSTSTVTRKRNRCCGPILNRWCTRCSSKCRCRSA